MIITACNRTTWELKSFFRSEPEKYPALTGIRACGAIAVFFDHFPLGEGFHPLINVMAFFYVLSGFLIVRLYYDKVRLDPGWLWDFFVRRFSRIYPVYFLLLTITILLNPALRDLLLHPLSNPVLLIKNYTLTHALFHYVPDIILGLSWSLTVEECFYFLSPVFMILARRYNFIVSFLFAVLLLLGVLYRSNSGGLFLQTPMFIFGTTFFGHFFEFFSGIALALIIMRLEKKGIPKKKGIKWTLTGSIGIFGLIIHMMYVYGHRPLDPVAIIVSNNFLIPIPIAMLYYGLIRENTWPARRLSGKIAEILGRSSYSFYLLHTIIIQYISVPLLSSFFGGHRKLDVFVTLTGTYLLSILLFMLYEEPLNLFIRRTFLLKRKAYPAVAGNIKSG